MADTLDMRLYLLGNGADKWIAEVEIASTLYRDTIHLSDYTDEKEAEGIAAWAAEYRWRKSVGNHWQPITVTRVDVAPAREEA